MSPIFAVRVQPDISLWIIQDVGGLPLHPDVLSLLLEPTTLAPAAARRTDIPASQET